MSDNMKEKEYENEVFTCWVKDNILHGIYKKNSIITVEAAKKIIELRLEAQQGKLCGAIAYFLDEVTVVTPDARRYFATEGYVGLTKLAIVTNSKLKAVIANVYIFIDRPVKPTRLFTESESAIKWLKE